MTDDRMCIVFRARSGESSPLNRPECWEKLTSWHVSDRLWNNIYVEYDVSNLHAWSQLKRTDRAQVHIPPLCHTMHYAYLPYLLTYLLTVWEFLLSSALTWGSPCQCVWKLVHWHGEPHVSGLKILNFWSIDMGSPMSVRLEIGPLTWGTPCQCARKSIYWHGKPHVSGR